MGFKFKKHSVEETRQRVQGVSHMPVVSTSTHYYVWGKTKFGRNYIDGPYNTEEEAWHGGYQALDGDFKVVPLRTIDLKAATRAIKRMDLDETRSIETSLARARHKL